MAHQVLTAFVNGPEWDTLPQLLQRQIYERTFERARIIQEIAQ